MNESYFDGKLHQQIGLGIISFLVVVCSLGILYPLACCWMYSWKTKHTVIEGRRLKFTGTAMGLFGNWIKWWFFCLITLGIFSFWLNIALEEWKVKHTVFAD